MKQLTCIECPRGCRLSAEIENGYVIRVSGQECVRGEAYAKQEVENPVRTLTSAVTAQGLDVSMVPVRTSAPIPKAQLLPAMAAVKALRLTRPVMINEVLVADFLGLQVDLIATRSVGRPSAMNSGPKPERRPATRRGSSRAKTRH